MPSVFAAGWLSVRSANSGIATADLPVSYTLPPELLTAWQTSNRPGLSLVGADLRPETMINNVRASVFPHLQQQGQSKFCLARCLLLLSPSKLALVFMRAPSAV